MGSGSVQYSANTSSLFTLANPEGADRKPSGAWARGCGPRQSPALIVVGALYIVRLLTRLRAWGSRT